MSNSTTENILRASEFINVAKNIELGLKRVYETLLERKHESQFLLGFGITPLVSEDTKSIIPPEALYQLITRDPTKDSMPTVFAVSLSEISIYGDSLAAFIDFMIKMKKSVMNKAEDLGLAIDQETREKLTHHDDLFHTFLRTGGIQ